MALTPTLTLWDVESRKGHASPDDTERPGNELQEIVASLTTNPAQRFGYSTRSGRIAKGMETDLVILRTDPNQNTSAFSKIRYTIRNREIICAER